MPVKHGILLSIVCKLYVQQICQKTFLYCFIGLKFIYIKVIQLTEVEQSSRTVEQTMI